MLQIRLICIHTIIHDNNRIHKLTMSISTRAVHSSRTSTSRRQTDRPMKFSLRSCHGILLLSFPPTLLYCLWPTSVISIFKCISISISIVLIEIHGHFNYYISFWKYFYFYFYFSFACISIVFQ